MVMSSTVMPKKCILYAAVLENDIVFVVPVVFIIIIADIDLFYFFADNAYQAASAAARSYGAGGQCGCSTIGATLQKTLKLD